MLFSGVKNSIGTGGVNDDDDIFATKKGLSTTGDHNPAYDLYDHPTSEPEKIFSNSVETFQQRFGLKKDGLMKPGGPTETTLRAETARVELEDAGLPDLPSPVKITQPIGRNQPNKPADVTKVQNAFQSLSAPSIGLNALAGSPPTLEGFQTNFGLKPDGIMLPGGPTETVINRLAGPIQALTQFGALEAFPGEAATVPAALTLGPSALNKNPLLVFTKDHSMGDQEPDAESPKDDSEPARKDRCQTLRERLRDRTRVLKIAQNEQDRLTDLLINARSEHEEAVTAFEAAKESFGSPGGISDLCNVFNAVLPGAAGRVTTVACTAAVEGTPLFFKANAVNTTARKIETAFERASENAERITGLLEKVWAIEEALAQCEGHNDATE